MTCHRGPQHERLVGPKHDGDHDSCDPCPDRHCRICGTRAVQPPDVTCPTCISHTRDDLIAIAGLAHFATLRTHAWTGGQDGRLEAARPIPGGEAMVMLGPTAHPEAWNHRVAAAIVRATKHPDAQRPEYGTAMLDEPAEDGSPLWVLGSWDLEWREVRDTPSDLRITVQRAADYLREHLTWAAQHHDAYDEFVTDLRSCRARLEAVLHAGERDDRAAAPCFDCGGQLVRQVHDHHGRDDRYTCRRCHREYAVAEYWLALRVQLEEEAAG